MSGPDYELVWLPTGEPSLRFAAYGETLHPVAGPVAEAEALYVKQLRLRERIMIVEHEFVIWDVGLGMAANALTAVRTLSDLGARLRVVSFDNTLDPLRFALARADRLTHLRGFETAVGELLARGKTGFRSGQLDVTWVVVEHDFPSAIARPGARSWPRPEAIFFDPFSPAKNPAMWTLPVLIKVGKLATAACNLATYSRSTFLRVTLLLAGFWVGVGETVAGKEETTIAATCPSLIRMPLDRKWLKRARVSHSAEPLHEAVYRQAPLTPETWLKLQGHPQFR